MERLVKEKMQFTIDQISKIIEESPYDTGVSSIKRSLKAVVNYQKEIDFAA